MCLFFLPDELKSAIKCLNSNYISEIRIRKGQPVIIEYKGEYKYINSCGVSENRRDAIIISDIEGIISLATRGCIYNYSEQMKSGFITVGHGVRIGIAGEYVTLNGGVQAIRNITSLNIRIPHNVVGCSDYIINNLYFSGLHSTMLYSKPGFGKTTMLRDMAIKLNSTGLYNILVFDERNEIAAIDETGNGYDLGDRTDIIRCHDKKNAISSAIRAMKPNVIITDELYGEDDFKAVKYAVDCGICVIASSHIIDCEILKKFPFEFFVKLTGIGMRPEIYDKNFNPYNGSSVDYVGGSISVGK